MSTYMFLWMIPLLLNIYDVKAHNIPPYNVQDEATRLCVASDKIYNIPSEECFWDESIDNLVIITRYRQQGLVLDNNQVINFMVRTSLIGLYLESYEERIVFVNIPQGLSISIRELQIIETSRFVFPNNIKDYINDLERLTFYGKYNPFGSNFKIFTELTHIELRYERSEDARGDFRSSMITEDLFTGLNSLVDLTISNAGIRKISKTAFNSLRNLKVINLSDNNIKHIPFDMFEGYNLTMLDLSGNNIQYVHAGSFRGLVSGIHLLKLNRNPNFPLETLVNIEYIQHLEIISNNYRTISPSMYYRSMPQLNVSGNELACSCENEWLTIGNEIYCHTNSSHYPLVQFVQENCILGNNLERLYEVYPCFLVRCSANEICNDNLVKESQCNIIRFLQHNAANNSDPFPIQYETILEENCGCQCQEGYQRNSTGVCIDIDECTAGTSKCQQTCINIIGGYECGCEQGYKESDDPYNCTKIDASLNGTPCVSNSTMVNVLTAWVVILLTLLISCCIIFFVYTVILLALKIQLDEMVDKNYEKNKSFSDY